jgi:hypothetical protein
MLRERFRDVKTNFYVGAHPTPRHVLEKVAAECEIVVSAAAD